MKKALRILLWILLAAVWSGFADAGRSGLDSLFQSPEPPGSPRPGIDRDFARMPLVFIPNAGQADAQVDFYVKGKDKTVFFTPEGLTFVLSDAAVSGRAAGQDPEKRNPYALKLDFVGANAGIRPVGENKNGALISFFRGNPDEWKVSLPAYSRIVYKELWPGIDLAYSGTVNKMKYEFVVHPGADPSRIRLAYRGASGLAVSSAGQLEITTPAGGFSDDLPSGYQEIDGRRTGVAMRYRLEAPPADGPEDGAEADVSKPRAYGFEVGEYDRSQPLVLDPAVLVYCGFIGGSGSDAVNGIAVDASGSAYVIGYSESTEATFPCLAGPDPTYNGGSFDAFVAKVNAAGTALVYCGYIGGASIDRGYGIAVDGSGNAYVTGSTFSDQSSFPVVTGPDLTYNGDREAFVAKLNATGTGLDYCGFIGGAAGDEGRAIAVDGSGNAYVTGYTYSGASSFTVIAGPYLSQNGYDDAFVAKVNAAGTGLVYCGYIGGSYHDSGNGIAVDGSGCAYVVGNSSSETNFPVTVGPDLTPNGLDDAFVAKVNAAGTGLDYCGYIGGQVSDVGYGVAVDTSGNAYVAGYSESSEATFPVVVGPDLTFNGGTADAFMAKVNATGSALDYCGYIGGSGVDRAYTIALDGMGNTYVAGSTQSTASSFPVVNGPDPTFNGSTDAFVAKVQAAGSALDFCGYIGGSGSDYAYGIAVDGSGNAYVSGLTYSAEDTFPILTGPDLSANGGAEAFVAKIAVEDDPKLITVTAPNGGEAWSAGSAYDITWTSSGSVGNVDILYSYDGGSSWCSILDDTENSGTYSWTVPDTPSTNCYVQVLEHDDGSPGDSSDAVFSIVTAGPLTVSGTISCGESPLAGVAMSGLPGTPLTNPAGFYSAEVDPGWSGTVTPTLFGYTFTPAQRTYTGISSDQTAQDYAAAVLPALRLVTPNGGENWTIGSTQTITWNVAHFSGTVRLVLFKGGVRFGNIATGIDAAAGSFTWNAGQTIEGVPPVAGSDYRLYLRSTDNTLVDASDRLFSLIAPAQLQVTSPNGGENWELGSTQNITWNANGYAGTVRIILFNRTTKIGQIAANIPAAQGSYAWTAGAYVGGTAAAGSLYVIRLRAADGSQEDYSDDPFTLSEAVGMAAGESQVPWAVKPGRLLNRP